MRFFLTFALAASVALASAAPNLRGEAVAIGAQDRVLLDGGSDRFPSHTEQFEGRKLAKCDDERPCPPDYPPRHHIP
jgi:hypothetical protein